MQQPTRYYITKSGEESTVRSVRVEQQPASSVVSSEARPVQSVDETVLADTSEQRRSVKDLVQDAIQKRYFFS